MKKRFILALLASAVVMTSVAPVLANAPIVRTLPTIILGDASDTGGGNSLYRSNTGAGTLLGIDLLDQTIAGVINWNNTGFVDTQFHVFYQQPAGDAAQYRLFDNNGAVVPGLTTPQFNAVVTPGGSGDITGLGANDAAALATANLDIYNETATAGGTGVADVPAATPTVDGIATGSVAGVTDGTSYAITIIAAVDNLAGGGSVASTLADSVGVLDVSSQTGVATSVLPPNIFLGPNRPSLTEWTFDPVAAGGLLAAASQFTDSVTGSIGFNVNVDPPVGGLMLGTYRYIGANASNLDRYPMVASGQAGKVYLASVRLRSDAATASDCPGYRINATSFQQTHNVTMSVFTNSASAVGGATNNAPFLPAGQGFNDFTATIAWTPPTGLVDEQDGGPLSNFFTFDSRNYTIIVDLFHNQVGDRGSLLIEEMDVRSINVVDLVSAGADIVVTGFDQWSAFPHNRAAIGEGTVSNNLVSKDLSNGQAGGAFGQFFTGVSDIRMALQVNQATSTYNDPISGPGRHALRIAQINAPFSSAFYVGSGTSTPTGSAAANLTKQQVNNQLVRYVFTLRSGGGAVNDKPIIRITIAAATNDANGNGTEGEFIPSTGFGETWTDWALVEESIYQFTTGSTDTANNNGKSAIGLASLGFTGPGAPQTTDTPVDVWVFSHNNRTGENAPYLYPFVEVISFNLYADAIGAGFTSGWPDDRGDVVIATGHTISSFNDPR